MAFDQTMVVGVFVGNRPTTGYRVEIAGVRKDGEALVVEWREVPPAAGATVNATVTTPFAVAGVTAPRRPRALREGRESRLRRRRACLQPLPRARVARLPSARASPTVPAWPRRLGGGPQAAGARRSG